jgi:plastocyanin
MLWQARQGIIVGRGALDPSGAAAATMTYESSATEASGGTTITYTAMAIGAADANRVVAVVFSCRAGAPSMVTSGVTIQGIAATQVSGAAGTNGTIQGGTDIWYASVPTGTTANVVVTWSSGTTATAAKAMRIITTTPAPTSASGTASTGTVASLNTSITVPSNGVGLAYTYAQSGPTVTWTNATSDDATVMSGGRTSDVSHTTGSGSISITAGYSVNSFASLSAAAWGP